jgi:hypothetical protein
MTSATPPADGPDYSALLETLQLRQAANRQTMMRRQELKALRQGMERQRPLET